MCVTEPEGIRENYWKPRSGSTPGADTDLLAVMEVVTLHMCTLWRKQNLYNLYATMCSEGSEDCGKAQSQKWKHGVVRMC